LGPEGRLYAFDQDRDTLANAPDDARFRYVESNFRFLRGALRLRGVTETDGILADLGVSSHHFDAVERGFSFRGEAPLDMRMNQRGGLTAAKAAKRWLKKFWKHWKQKKVISMCSMKTTCPSKKRSTKYVKKSMAQVM